MDGHIALLSNPRAGKGRGAAAAQAAAAALRALGTDVREFSGSTAEETRTLAERALSEGPDVLAVVGGDGTLAGIIDVLLASAVPVALIPSGTGNDFARALGVPRGDPASAAVLAVRGAQRIVDVGQVRSGDRVTHFLTVAALGFDAKVSDRTNRLRWPRGAARYYLALVIELLRLRPMRFRVAADGGAPHDQSGTLIAVGNTASYGGGMPVCAGASADDGLLDVVHVAPLGRLRLLMLFPLLLAGRHLHRAEVQHRRVARLDVTAPGLVVYADGEAVAAGECTISVLPRALHVMVEPDTVLNRDPEEDDERVR